MQNAITNHVSKLETRLMISLSTAHIQKKDSDILTDLSSTEELSSYVICFDTGFIIRRLTLQLLDKIRDQCISDDLINVFKYAIDRNFQVVEFDCDGPYVDELQKFEW